MPLSRTDPSGVFGDNIFHGKFDFLHCALAVESGACICTCNFACPVRDPGRDDVIVTALGSVLDIGMFGIGQRAPECFNPRRLAHFASEWRPGGAPGGGGKGCGELDRRGD